MAWKLYILKPDHRPTLLQGLAAAFPRLAKLTEE